jgi:fluoride exporter
MNQWLAFLLVGLGGAVGSMLRYAVKLVLPQPDPAAFPWATLVVNVVGSFAIGLLGGVLTGDSHERYRLFILVGVLGGFTTYSSFALEADQLFRAERWWIALVYIAATNVLCISLAAIGYRLMKP